MKEIQLTQGQTAIVDDEDYEYLNQWKWQAYKNRNTFYAIRKVRLSGKRYSILMHRLVIKAEKGQIVDHRNGNGLDNRKENLRFCTHSQNNANRKANGVSKYLGVCLYKRDLKWKATIRVNGKPMYLGQFTNETDAAKAYNEAAIIHHKEFARLNVF